MSASDYELEKKLLEAGEKLLDPLPSNYLSLVPLLDELFLCLSEVGQDPPGSIEDALSPSMKALVSERLFKHWSSDVIVAVTSCIIEVTRITAPNAPYDDDKMRQVFQLVVSSFEHLADKSSPSYTKRTSILGIVARARVSVLMLDLECDSLIIEMFQHFLKALRDHHPMKVSSDMENIMTLVLEESDNIPPGLLSPILRYVKKDDKIPQVSRRLAEQVLINCASKLKTYLNEAVKSLGVSLDKYSDVVASICEGRTFSGLKQNEVVTHQNEVISLSGLKQNEVVTHQNEDTHKAAEVSIPEQTCVLKRGWSLEHSLPRDKSVNAAIFSINEAVSLRRETVDEAVVNTEEADPAETETQTHKKARVESCSLDKARGEMEKTAAEGEPSCPTRNSSTEPGDLQRRKVPQPCSVTHQLAKVKQSIVDTITSVREFRSELEAKEQSLVDTITSVRQFRSELETKEQSLVDTLTSVRQFGSEIKKKEDNLEASVQEVDVLGM